MLLQNSSSFQVKRVLEKLKNWPPIRYHSQSFERKIPLALEIKFNWRITRGTVVCQFTHVGFHSRRFSCITERNYLFKHLNQIELISTGNFINIQFWILWVVVATCTCTCKKCSKVKIKRERSTRFFNHFFSKLCIFDFCL